MPKAELDEEINQLAESEDISFDAAVDLAVRDMPKEDVAYLKSLASDRESSEAKGSKRRMVDLPTVGVIGDVTYDPARTSGIKHGHNHIYVRTNWIVHAPGPGRQSTSARIGNIKSGKGTRIMTVKSSRAKRQKAGRYADIRYKNRSYNYVFFSNKKSDKGRLNCSQLVWFAYKRAAGIDLDGDGGPGVYPVDIRDSPKTRTWKTL